MPVSPIGPLPNANNQWQRRPFHVNAQPLAAEAGRAITRSSEAVVQSVQHMDWASLWDKTKKVFTTVGHGLFTLVTGTSFAELKTVETPNDPDDVNWDDASKVEAADTQRKAAAAAERKALAKLSPADRTTYKDLQTALGDRVLATRALQKLLVEGRLSGNLLAGLGGLAKQPLADGVDRAALINDTLREVEDPVRVAQHWKGTCGATTAQILLIRQDPTEYVRLVAGLASPAGTVQAKGGTVLRRASDWSADNDGGRSVSSRLIQPAFMKLGEVLFAGYDNSDDAATIGPLHLGGGLLPQGEASLLRQVTGKGYHSHMAMPWNRGALMDRLAKETANGPIPVSLNWGDGGHFVQVDKVADGKVYLTNPWGEQDTMDVAEFKAHLTSIITA
ncbi:MAG: hypothetical protein JWM80_900 [Cyanobacteria bacterium RYN_339]|nr:hypothetical protein [Cyanobacteria bacterium RYN_339]